MTTHIVCKAGFEVETSHIVRKMGFEPKTSHIARKEPSLLCNACSVMILGSCYKFVLLDLLDVLER